MLKTALQAKWIAALVFALILATVFVVLSAWQFGESQSEGNPVQDITETPVPLTEIHEPGQSMSIYEADRIVDLSGSFLEDSEVAVAERLHDGVSGYWVVGAFEVDDSPEGEVIPMVLGWTDSLDSVDELPDAEELEVQGRLMPPEAPASGDQDLPAGVFSTLSSAELTNTWDARTYSGFVVAFDIEDSQGEALGAAAPESSLEEVWVGPQPESSDVNWLNLFYALEWVVFAGFAVYLWYRMVRDDHEKRIEEARLDREWQEQWQREQLALRRQQREQNDDE